MATSGIVLPNSGSKNDFPFATSMPEFPEERPGWGGYVEWEKYPEKAAKAAEILSQYKFPGPPEFQLVPIPDTNPILEGIRWKQYHYAMGNTLRDLPDISWKYVKAEKSEDMIHVLQFPYNGEPPRKRLVDTEITDNKDFFVRNHGGVPEIEEDAYDLDLDGLVRNPKKITLKELKDERLFPRQSNVVSLQCSGTRRIEQIREYPGDGVYTLSNDQTLLS